MGLHHHLDRILDALAGISQRGRSTHKGSRRVTWRQRSRRNGRSRGCCPRECCGRDRRASRMVVGLHAEPVACDATHDGRHHPQRTASRRGADSPEFRGIRWRPLGNHNAWTPSCGTSLRMVFTRFIKAFSFSPGFGILQRSKHPTADQSPPKTPPIPAPISRLIRTEPPS